MTQRKASALHGGEKKQKGRKKNHLRQTGLVGSAASFYMAIKRARELNAKRIKEGVWALQFAC
jgi:hypothetical protein